MVFIGLLLVFCCRFPAPRFQAMLLGIALMTGYGILQDQVSVRLCPEYFTVFHPQIEGLTDPTLLGIAWGFLASWWGGALFGYFLGLVATSGDKPPVPTRRLVAPMLLTLVAVAVGTAVTGVTVDRHLEQFGVSFPEHPSVSPEAVRWAFVVGCYHFVTYALSVVGSVTCCIWLARVRNHSDNPTPGEKT
jgi:hypothetical protein